MTLRHCAAFLAVVLLSAFGADAAESGADQPFTVEYYYKIKWGYYDEWLNLYKKNHWPIMLVEMKDGYIVDIKVHQPQNYWPESHRWDMRVTITFKNVLVPHGLSDRSSKRQALIARLHPDSDSFEREERRRFELLEGFWDVELEPVATGDWASSGQKASH